MEVRTVSAALSVISIIKRLLRPAVNIRCDKSMLLKKNFVGLCDFVNRSASFVHVISLETETLKSLEG